MQGGGDPIPTQIDLTDKPLNLSNEFAYEHAGGDDIYVAAFQGSHPMSDEQVLKPGDTVDSNNTLTAFTLGEARLNQFSHEEELPGSEPAPKPKAEKPKAKAKAKPAAKKKAPAKKAKKK